MAYASNAFVEPHADKRNKMFLIFNLMTYKANAELTGGQL